MISTHIAIFSVGNSRNDLKYETSTDSDRKSFVQATEKRARKSSFSPFLNQEKVDSRVLDNTLQRLYFAGLWIVNSAKEWVQALYKVRNWVQNGCNFEM
jgi:hypothetical protein